MSNTLDNRQPAVLGIDGKVYPCRLSPELREYVFGRCHYLAHVEHMSIRRIREQLLYDHRIARSVGSIAADLKHPCEVCSGAANGAPEQKAGADA